MPQLLKEHLTMSTRQANGELSKFNRRWNIDEINEYIYGLIVENKHLDFVLMLDPDVASFSSFSDKYIIPNTSVYFAYQDMVQGYSISFSATPSVNILSSKRKPFTLDDELIPTNLYCDVSPVSGLKELNDKAFKDMNRFRSDFLMTLNGLKNPLTEAIHIKYNFTFDFNNAIIDASISFEFSYFELGLSNMLYNFRIGKDGIMCGTAHKNNYQNFLTGTTSKHMMLKSYLSNVGIDNDLETRNHTKEEVSNLMLLVDMKRI